MPGELTHQMVPTNGTKLHVVTAGGGFPVVLLHGFPQTWYEWRHVIGALGTQHRVIAPDLRGMGDSSPQSTGQEKRTLAADIKGMLDTLGIARAVIVGHDWGGAVAQRFALDFPSSTEKLVCINIGYFPGAPSFPEYKWPASQLIHSWYIFFHLNPVLPEQIAEAAGAAYIRFFFERGSGPEGSPFREADIAEYARWFTQPGRATAGFNLYRTAFQVDVDHWLADRGRVLEQPTLWIHGMQDPFVPAAVLDFFPPGFVNLQIKRLEAIGHWVPEEAPEELTAVLQEFLQDLA